MDKQVFKNLAKPDETIPEHIIACYNVAKQLIKIFDAEMKKIDYNTIIGDNIFIFSVIFHDFGKYAQPFQNKTLNSNYIGYWHYRHEIFSAEFVNLILDLSEDTKDLIKLVILSHHNKTIYQLEQGTFEENNMPSFVPGLNLEDMNNTRKEVYNEGKFSIIKYFSEISKEIKDILNKLDIKVSLNFDSDRLENVFALIRRYYNAVSNTTKDFDYKKIIFLKGLLVTADHLGSAHKSIKFVEKDIENSYKKKFEIPKKGNFNTIQKKCIQSNGATAILKAPTGAGKTEASFLWINENIKKNPYSRIFYILPYTASINAMFERLNTSDFSKNKVDLLHGKSISYYFDLLTRNISEEKISENITEINQKIKLQKLTAKSFVNPIKIVTPHQIVKHFYGVKHFEEAFIQYRNGLFVVDEIHCYDKIFLAELITVIKKIKDEFNGKFLFMSATFPKIIEELLTQYLEIKHKRIEFKNSELYKYTKTKLNLIKGLIEEPQNIEQIQSDIKQGKRILIVCNTINKAQKIFKQIKTLNKIIIHSAFNINDRKSIEQKILESEKRNSNKRIQVLVGTQTIEVSLDLDYDCCYSELASIDALIQRFGRVYRNRKKNKDEYGIVNVFLGVDKATKLIYNEKDENFISKTYNELRLLNNKPLDYTSLCKAVDNVFSKNYGNTIKQIIDRKLEIMEDFELIPMNDYSNEAKVYFEQFDGVKILPESLLEKYKQFLEEKRFIESEKLLVTLSERKLFNYYKQNYAYQLKLYGKNIFIADENILKYDNKIGLYLNKENESLDKSIFL